MGFTQQWASYSKILTRERDEAMLKRRARLRKTEPSVEKVGVISRPARHGEGVTSPRLYCITAKGETISSEMEKGCDLESTRVWTLKTAERMKNQSDFICSMVLEVPTWREVTLDSLALAFDISRPEITRCNGMTGRQILTPSILVPISSRLKLGETDIKRMETREPADNVARFMRECSCDIFVAQCYLVLYPDSYVEAVKGYREDEAWEIDQATAPPPYGSDPALSVISQPGGKGMAVMKPEASATPQLQVSKQTSQRKGCFIS